MTYSLFISLREGLEAFLIIAIVLSYLARTNQRRYFTHVWLGAVLAFLASVAAGVALEMTAASLSGRIREAFEGAAMLFAVVVLTTMIFWMKRQAATIGLHLRSQVDAALSTGSALALALLAFTSVGREGLETVLFLFAGSTTTDSEFLYWLGTGLGLVIAAGLATIVYRGSARLPLSAFFNVTGIVLIILAAGLLTNSFKELYEAAVIPAPGPHVWDTYDIIPDNSNLGRLLGAILGYDSSPRLGQVVAYLSYLAVFLPAFLLGRQRIVKATPAPQTTATTSASPERS